MLENMFKIKEIMPNLSFVVTGYTQHSTGKNGLPHSQSQKYADREVGGCWYKSMSLELDNLKELGHPEIHHLVQQLHECRHGQWDVVTDA